MSKWGNERKKTAAKAVGQVAGEKQQKSGAAKSIAFCCPEKNGAGFSGVLFRFLIP